VKSVVVFLFLCELCVLCGLLDTDLHGFPLVKKVCVILRHGSKLALSVPKGRVCEICGYSSWLVAIEHPIWYSQATE
jgi:hypothetical protein